MQNQDPLNPMDNAQVTSQMAQINTVTGIEKLNTTVQGLSSQFVQLQALQGAALVGRDVIVAGNTAQRRRRAASARAASSSPAPADAVKVEILDAERPRGRHARTSAPRAPAATASTGRAGTAPTRRGLTLPRHARRPAAPPPRRRR